MRVIAVVAAFACAAIAQEKAPFAVAGWSNVHEQDCGRIATTLFGEPVRSPARGLASFVSRPADHVVDGAGVDGEGVTRERLGFPLELWDVGGDGLGAQLPLALPKDFDHAFAPIPCTTPTLLRRAVEHSVAVAVRRDASGRILAIGAAPGIQARPGLPGPDAAFLAGWHAQLLDAGRETLPSPLREIAARAPPIGVVVGLRARIEDETWAGALTLQSRTLDEVEGVVAADGRFRLVVRGARMTEGDEATVDVAIELACDLSAVYIGVAEWPTRCVWPRDHARIADVLRTDARVALPLIAWARDPYWFAPSSRLEHAVDMDGAHTRIDESAPDEGLLGVVRHLVDARCDPPRLDAISVLGIDGSVELEHRFEGDMELAPGYRRPMRVVTRWWGWGTHALLRQRTVTILAARIGAESSVESWRPGAGVTDWRVQR
ncbi:MAG: hypothetical protein HZB39_01775 [Planctomycetes bacterium]|nr:hypothetical protein [Planctomycetota bacterium]